MAVVPPAWTKKCEEDAEKCKKPCNISDGKIKFFYIFWTTFL
jgi:hypothetical protein